MPATAQSHPKTDRFYSVQILRGLAAVLVVLHHQSHIAIPVFGWQPSTRFFDNGAFGVDLFFPISGFVIYLTASSLLRQDRSAPDWRDFAWRRFLRVAPPYWFFTVLKLALFFAVPATMLHYRFQASNTVAGFLFLPAYNFEHAPEPPLGVGWTLNYEMLFYAMVTLSIACRRPVLRFCAPIITTLAILGLIIPHAWSAFSYLADPIELEFLAGMFIAAGFREIQRLPWWVPAAILPAALTFALILAPGGSTLIFQPQRALFYGIPGALVLASVVALEPRLNLRPQRSLLLLGDASYSLYLLHTFIVPATGLAVHPLRLAGAMGLLCFFVLGLALCVGASIAFHLYVELPMFAALTRYRMPWSMHSADA